MTRWALTPLPGEAVQVKWFRRGVAGRSVQVPAFQPCRGTPVAVIKTLKRAPPTAVTSGKKRDENHYRYALNTQPDRDRAPGAETNPTATRSHQGNPGG